MSSGLCGGFVLLAVVLGLALNRWVDKKLLPKAHESLGANPDTVNGGSGSINGGTKVGGGSSGLTLSFKDLTYSVQGGKKPILKEVTGKLTAGQVQEW